MLFRSGTPGTEISATVYFFRSPQLASLGSPQSVVADAQAHLCESQFRAVEREITSAHRDAQLLEEEAVTTSQQGVTFAGHKAVYKMSLPNFFGRAQTTRSEAYLFCYAGGQWSVEYRIDYPADHDAAGAIAKFMHDFQWTITPQP